MKVEVEDVSPVRKNMAVEADPEEVAREKRSLLQQYARRARIPGFRPGKAPLSLVQARFGQDVAEDLKERLVQRLFHRALRQEGIRLVGHPHVEEVSLGDDDRFRFTTSFEVLPEFTPKNYRGVEVRAEPVEVEDEEVLKVLDSLRESRARLVPEEGRAAESGDVVVADVEGTPEGESAFRRENMMIEVGGEANLPEFNEHLTGARAGDERVFTVTYPEDYDHKPLAGRKVSYKVQVREVKRREIPELDDAFARDLGEFENLDALRERIRENLRQEKEAEARREMRERVLDKVLLENPIPLPEVLVEEEVRYRLEHIVRNMMQQGVDPRTADIPWEQVRERQMEPARKAVHARLVLDAIARAEDLQVEDQDIEETLRREAERTGESATSLRARVEKDGGLEVLKIQLLREKSLDFLVSVANIQSEE